MSKNDLALERCIIVRIIKRYDEDIDRKPIPDVELDEVSVELPFLTITFRSYKKYIYIYI